LDCFCHFSAAIRTLPIMDAMERQHIIPVKNETEASETRTTKEGKQITYEMKVLQEPQRARACGAGAKCECSALPPMTLLTSAQLPQTGGLLTRRQSWS
jgi:hypothetical protein